MITFPGESPEYRKITFSKVWTRLWGSEMLYAPADPKQDPRHLGLFEPSWNMFDITRAGRKEDWDEQLQYDDACACASNTAST